MEEEMEAMKSLGLPTSFSSSQGLAKAAKMEEEMEAMESLGLPTTFDSSQEPKKPVATNLALLEANKRSDKALDFVYQVVYTNSHSYCPALGSLVRQDLERMMPLPILVIHSLWPSFRNSGPIKVSILKGF